MTNIYWWMKYLHNVGTIMLWTSLFLSCISNSSSSTCDGEYLLDFEQELIIAGQLTDYYDRDCDQIPYIDDCDDSNPELLSKRYDTDCDGVLDRNIFSAGAMHNCTILPNQFGALQCWGSDYFGQTEAPSGVFLEIGSGVLHSCALSVLNEVICWGDNSYGQLDVPAGSFKRVFAGDYHSCAITEEQSVVCWGAGSTTNECAPSTGLFECGQSQTPTARFKDLSLGLTHSCGRLVDNTISCWGDDSEGNLSVPEGGFSQLTTHQDLSCGLDDSGKMTCWGQDAQDIEECNDTCAYAFDGECDDGVLNAQFSVCDWGTDCSDCGSRVTLENQGNEYPVANISTGENNLCYVNTEGNLFCINSLSAEELGINDYISPNSYSDDLFSLIDIGPYYNGCGVSKDGRMQCWGASCFKEEDLSFNCLYGVLNPPNDLRLWNSPVQDDD